MGTVTTKKKTAQKTVRSKVSINRRDSGGYKPIEDYGIIGDMHTIALVAKDGSIDWCCLPRFDSPSIFAGILDSKTDGFFKISPVRPAVQKQMYVPQTCVLVTRFLSEEGVGEVVDLMPVQEGKEAQCRYHQIVRRVRVVRGTVHFRLECFPAFDYARARHTLKLSRDGALFTSTSGQIGLMSLVNDFRGHERQRGRRRSGVRTKHRSGTHLHTHLCAP